ncbi:MAG: LysR family transcriptional regulator [Halopseudomonas aestusnigri]
MQTGAATIPVEADWRDIRTSLEVHRAHSLKAASTRLRITESTVSRRVTSLERHLGLILFERTPNGMAATVAGLNFFDQVINAENYIEKGIEAAQLSQSSPEGYVRITAVPIIANHMLMGEAPSLMTEFPKLELDIVGAPAELSLLRRETDIALRLARPNTEADTLTRKLGSLQYGIFTKREALSSDFKHDHLPWLTYNDEMAKLPQARWILEYSKTYGEPISPLRCYDAEGLLGAILTGYGKTLLPVKVASKFPELVEIKSDKAFLEREIWLIAHPNLVQTRRMRVVINWLSTVFSNGPRS